jgi:hypothetical protein
MDTANYFFVLFLATITFTRILLRVKPLSGPTIKGLRLHHYMYGLVLIPFGFILDSVTLYAVGWGLFADEVGVVLFKFKTYEEYYSKTSLVSVIVIIILVFLFREKIIFWLS